MAAWSNFRRAFAIAGIRRRTGVIVCLFVVYQVAGSAVQAQNSDETIGVFGPAVEWSIESQAKVSMEADINRRLQPGNHQSGFTLDLDGGLTLGAETKRSEVFFDLGVSRTIFLGENQPNTDNTQRFDPRFSMAGNYRGKTYTLSAEAGFDFRPTSFTQEEDTGITNDETTQLTINYAAGLELILDRRNQLTLSTNADIVEFTDPAPGLIATRTFGADVSWQHQLTETTALTFSGGGRYFTSFNPQETESQTFDVSFGLTHRRTARHTFGVNAGITAVRTDEIAPTGFRDVDFTVGVTGGASFEYGLKNLNIGIDITQSVDPSATGALQSFSRLNSTLGYDINDLEQVGVTAGFFRRAPLSGGGSTLHSLSLGPNYSLQLTPATQLSLGYLFRMNQESEDGTSTGHRVFLTLTKDFDLVP